MNQEINDQLRLKLFLKNHMVVLTNQNAGLRKKAKRPGFRTKRISTVGNKPAILFPCLLL